MSDPAPPAPPEAAGQDTPSPQVASSPLPLGAIPVSGAQLLTPLGLAVEAPGLSIQQVQLWQGQFPPPEAVEHYEKLLPGVFHRIVTMAEQQSSASIQGTAEARTLLRSDMARGQWLGWSVAVLAIVGAVLLGITNHPTVAAVLVAVPVMSVAIALVNGAMSKPGKALQAPQPPKSPEATSHATPSTSS